MSGRRILIVDDDDSIRELVELVLSDRGYEVLTAADGQTALSLAASTAPALILLDMRMPVMDGWAFASAYHARPGPHAPIVVVTAARDASASAAQIAADAWIAKPFDLEALASLVRRFVP